jgi:hypothetical protein
MIVRCLIAAVALAVATVAPAGAVTQAVSASGYTVSSTADGVEVTVHFARRDFPKDALIAVTDTIQNLSHPHLEMTREHPYGFCAVPAVSMRSVTATGQSATPVQPMQPHEPNCPAMVPSPVPIGHSYSEQQYLVLWSPRLEITARLYTLGHHSYRGFSFPKRTVHFTLHAARPGKVTLKHRSGLEFASVTPPPGPHGPLYIQSWGECASPGANNSTAYYWIMRRGPTVPAICPAPTQWHLDAAWLNTSVASLDVPPR